MDRLGPGTAPRVLSPPQSALTLIQKPALEAGRLLQIAVPPSAAINHEWALHAFCRRSGWDVWVKGVWGDAICIGNWPELRSAAAEMAELEGGRGGVFVQRHIDGRGEAVAFCARREAARRRGTHQTSCHRNRENLDRRLVGHPP